MNISRRRGAIATFITFGVLLTGLTITLNIDWIVHNKERSAYLVVGIILFAVLVAGVVLNTVFLVREIRRNERQDSFLNAVTHELKTPIASIRLYLETLQRRDLPEAQRREFYTIMHADSDRLLATVEQVLKAGELGQRQRMLNRTLIELEPLVAGCIGITLQRHHLPPEAICLEPTPGEVKLHVLGLPEDLTTAILNLLENAVKYSPEGVHIRASLSITRYTWLSLRITDTGVGLAENQLKRIFNRFYRVPGRNQNRIKGTGLGLFLVRTIAKQHGGTVTAQSPGPNQGTTITLKLPLANPTGSPATTLYTRQRRIERVYNICMATTTATVTNILTTTAIVTANGLQLPAGFMAEHNMLRGTQVTITLPESPLALTSEERKRVVDELHGMFADGPSMTEELLKHRREEDLQSKW